MLGLGLGKEAEKFWPSYNEIQVTDSPVPIFQCCCSCAIGMCTAFCGRGLVTRAFSRYGNSMCTLTTGLHCDYTGAGKLDRIGLWGTKKIMQISRGI